MSFKLIVISLYWTHFLTCCSYIMLKRRVTYAWIAHECIRYSSKLFPSIFTGIHTYRATWNFEEMVSGTGWSDCSFASRGSPELRLGSCSTTSPASSTAPSSSSVHRSLCTVSSREPSCCSHEAPSPPLPPPPLRAGTDHRDRSRDTPDPRWSSRAHDLRRSYPSRRRQLRGRRGLRRVSAVGRTVPSSFSPLASLCFHCHEFESPVYINNSGKRKFNCPSWK